jgi:hypothetical protein
MLRHTVPPTLAGRWEAPKMATLAGENRESRLRMLTGVPLCFALRCPPLGRPCRLMASWLAL